MLAQLTPCLQSSPYPYLKYGFLVCFIHSVDKVWMENIQNRKTLHRKQDTLPLLFQDFEKKRGLILFIYTYNPYKPSLSLYVQ